MSTRSNVVLLALAWSAVASPARAQSDDAAKRVDQRVRELDEQFRLEEPKDATISERALLDYGASVTAGVYSIDDDESDHHTLRQYDGRLWMRAELDGTHRFFGRLKFRYDDWNSGDSFGGGKRNLENPIGDRWWYQFDLRGAHESDTGQAVPWDYRLKLGKQYVEWGNGLALSNVLVGGLFEAEWNHFALDLLAGDTPASDFVDFDASRPRFDTSTKRRFVGALFERRGRDVTPFVHLLRQTDRNSADFALFVDGLGQLYPTRFDYDSDYAGVGARGELGQHTSWRVELDHETGRALSSPVSAIGTPTSQTREKIRAWALDAQLQWAARDERRSRLELEAIAASGDDDRLDSADTFGGNLRGTTDRAWNAFGFLDTGLALAPDPSNLAILRLGHTTSPILGRGESLERLRLVTEAYAFLKLDENAPINVPTTNHRYVGCEVDAGVDWNVWSDLTLTLRYGIFLPGTAMPSGQDGTRQVAYAGVTYAF